MKKQVSSLQLSLNFDFEESATLQSVSKAPTFSFSFEAYREWQATENDILTGRGDFLYQAFEKAEAFDRKQAEILHQFEQMRASIYQ